MPIVLDGSQGITTPMYNGSITANAVTPSVNMKNRIINGAMVIDQRNAGASVTVNAVARFYSLDRFFGYGESSDGVFTIQQSSTAPTGFTNSAIITTTTADASVGASQYYLLGHSVEGFNTADLNWGTANAKTVTLSFWVRSSLTGQFGGSLTNSGNTRSYPFSYTISSANTWEQKTITIAGDTSGTWLTTNGVGINIYWDLGCGSSNIGTAGSWSGSSFFGATGDTKLISTNGATFYITGVQLEVGSTATSFDYRPYGTELALCQRYYNKMTMPEYVGINGFCDSTTDFIAMVNFPVVMRDSPTFTSTAAGANLYIRRSGGTSNTTNIYQTNGGTQNSRVFASVASGLTGGQGAALASAPSQTTFIAWSAEL